MEHIICLKPLKIKKITDICRDVTSENKSKDSSSHVTICQRKRRKFRIKGYQLY